MRARRNSPLIHATGAGWEVVSKVSVAVPAGKASGASAPLTPTAWAGLLFTPIRWIAGWMFLSAFIRRVIDMPAKLAPGSQEYMGHAFTHFLPHALVVGPMIDYLLHQATLLQAFLVLFTVLEGLIGLFLVLGLMSRLVAMGSSLLAFGILLGSGWLGSTCVDEWQIGSLLVGTGAALALSGGGPISADQLLLRWKPRLRQTAWFPWLFSGDTLGHTGGRCLHWTVLVVAIVTSFVMLATYQAFHNGLWGGLYNASKLPNVVISDPSVSQDGAVQLTLYRDGGPDTYGAFIVSVKVLANGQPVEVFTPAELAMLPKTAVKNETPLALAKASQFALVLPLSAKAAIDLPPAAPDLALSPREKLTIAVYDVSGAGWTTPAVVR